MAANFEHIRIVPQMLWSGGVIQNVFHFRIADVGTATTELDVLTDAAAAIDTMYSTININLTNEMTYDTIYGYNETLGIPMGTVGWPTLTTGGSAVTPLPEATALMFRIPTGLPRREGRKYLGIYHESANDAGATVAPGPLANVSAFFAAFSFSGILPNFGVQLQGRVRTVQFGVPVYVTTPTFTVNNQWDYQRRRKAGVGI